MLSLSHYNFVAQNILLKGQYVGIIYMAKPFKLMTKLINFMMCLLTPIIKFQKRIWIDLYSPLKNLLL